MAKLKSHPYADLFPMMAKDELDALAEDIKENGLRQDIVLYQGAILDGRNRHAACTVAGVEPRFVEHEGDDDSALALVISLNIQRRDLTAGQRALVAMRCMNNTPLTREGRKKLSSQFKIGENAIQQARALLTEAADLAAKVENRLCPLATAYGEFQERQKDMQRQKKDMDRVAEYAEAIANGDMTLEEALQKAIEREREEKEKTQALADARQHWLEKLIGVLEWSEQFIGKHNDDALPWYTKPDSPGLFDHRITVERLDQHIAQMTRVRNLTFGGNNGETKKGTSRRR
jgi:hypothetical protein